MVLAEVSRGHSKPATSVAGLARKLHTAQSVKDFSVEDQLLKTNDWDAIDKTFENILI